MAQRLVELHSALSLSLGAPLDQAQYMPHICYGAQAMPPTMASHEPSAHVSEFEDWTGPPALVRPRAVIAQFVLAWNESSTHVHAVEPPAPLPPLDPFQRCLFCLVFAAICQPRCNPTSVPPHSPLFLQCVLRGSSVLAQ